MGFDDLAADRQAEAGVLAEGLAGRPVGIEALEDAVDVLRPQARTIVVHHDDDMTTRAVEAHLDAAALVGHEGPRIGDQVRQHLAQPQIVTHDEEPFLAGGKPAASEVDLDLLAAICGLAGRRNQVRDELLQLHTPRILAGEFGIEPGGVGNVGDQAVEAPDVVLDYFEKPCARLVVAGERQCLHRTAQGRQRVLQLMADVGSEALDRLDACIERIRHVAQRHRQIADLVLTVGEIGYLLAALDAAPHPHGGGRQPAQRIGDGRGKDHRQDRGDDGRHAEDAQDRAALGGNDLVDIAALRRQHQGAEHGAVALDGNGDRDDLLALLADADDRCRAARQGVHHLGKGGAVAARLLAVERQVVAAEEIGQDVLGGVEQAGLLLDDRFEIVAQDLPARIKMPRIEDQVGVAVVDAGARARGRNKPPQDRRDAFGINRKIEAVELVARRRQALSGLELEQLFGIDAQRIRLDGRRGGDGAGDDLALRHQALDARVDQPLAELVEIEDA